MFLYSLYLWVSAIWLWCASVSFSSYLYFFCSLNLLDLCGLLSFVNFENNFFKKCFYPVFYFLSFWTPSTPMLDDSLLSYGSQIYSVYSTPYLSLWLTLNHFINLYSSFLILSFAVSSLLISLGKEFFISSIYIFSFKNFYLILFIVSIILLKFSICECMMFTFSTKACNTLITVILKSLFDNSNTWVILGSESDSVNCLLTG